VASNSQQSIENNFSGGLKTEFTGLNFPENSCTSASNCVFSIIGDVNRREGFDFQDNYQLNTLTSPSSVAIATYKWNNVGGDGSTQIVVQQVGKMLYFYLSSNSTTTNPLSKQLLATTVDVSTFLATNAILSFDSTIECTFADGNGYLIVFNGQCDPFYVTYNSGTQTVTATRITIQVRDFAGLNDGLALSTRPPTLSAEHNYNLVNQGWGGGWTAISTSTNTIGTGSFTFIVASGLPIGVGSTVTARPNLAGSGAFITGTVTSYSGTTLIFTETSNSGSGTYSSWTISAGSGSSGDTISAWYNVLKSYPANCDVWWYYRNTNVTSNAPSGVFQPSLANTGYILPTNAQAPQGSIIFPAFIQDRTTYSGVPGLTTTSTVARPTNGCFYAGRAWYTGVNASFQATGDAPYSTWTETIYFSQVVQTPDNFSECYQLNDPTSSTLSDLLPTDGGTLIVQGSGPIYKLFPVQNGLLVFAANGIWYITGGQAIGFTANNYSINKISGVQSIGSHSYVNVLGWPVFWNAEGIYEIKPDSGNTPYGQGGFVVQNLCLGTILSYYEAIPLQSKLYARGDYDPISYTIQWLYRSTVESGISNRYTFDSALNINTFKGPFYPYSFTYTSASPYITSILYVNYPQGSTAPDPMFEYLTVYGSQYTFSEEKDSTAWKDWSTAGGPIDYTSSFTTGYKLHGQAWKLWWLGYIYVYSNNSTYEQTAYGIRGLWDYGTSGTSGKWSTQQIITNNIPNFGNVARRIKIRGHGKALQLQFNSVSGYPFNFVGWATWEQINQGP